MTWLLTSAQAHFSHRRAHRARGRGIGAVGQLPALAQDVLAQSASGSQLTSETEEQLTVRSALRRCPKCQSEHFTDRRVTRANPASMDASGTELP
jgi:DNA-directed RNA polymerase specialized sigma24 family protein